MKLKYKIIFAAIFISLLFNFILSIYLIKQERVLEIKRLDEIIERTGKMIRLTNIGPLFDVDKEKVRLNIETIFKNNAEIVKISLVDMTETIKIDMSRDDLLRVADKIEKEIVVDKDGLKLADIKAFYTTYYLEKRLNFLKLKMIMLILGLLVSNILIVVYGKLQSIEFKAGERRFHAIFSQTFQLIGLLQPDGRLIEMNQTALDQAKVKQADIQNQYFWDTPWWRHLSEEQQKLKAAIEAAANGRFIRYETVNRLADESVLHIDFSIKPVKDDHDQIVLLIAEGRDITERIQAAEALLSAHNELENRVEERTRELSQTVEKLKLAKAEADAAAKAKSEFLANMSHEIRTPMNGVIAVAELALKEEASPKVSRYLEIINNSGHTLLEIINEILDFSKIEAGKIVLEHQPFNLKDMFDSVLNIFAEKTDFKRIELLVDIDPDIRMALIGDQYRIQQILVNLAGNAYKFTPQGGTITIGVKPGKDGADSNASVMTFFVEDTGVGIKQEHLKSLFEPFTQEDASTTRQFGGTGLGLAICKQLVELMDGRIGVESQPGKGSSFFFTIKLELQPIKHEVKFIVPDFIFGLQTLVVDDSTQSRAIMEKILQSFGIRAEAVPNGELAIKKLSEDIVPYGLVIIDQDMPGMDGLNVIRKVREDLHFSMPIILMGGGGTTSDSDKGPFNYFLPKPITPSSLYDAILTVFNFIQKDMTKTVPKAVESIKDAHCLNGLKVLVVEDNPTNQEIALAVLDEAGIQAEIAENGKIGVERIKTDNYDLVLMDMQMPVMDGYEAVRIIRQDLAYASLPIIAMTANALKGDREKCLKAGMDEYISKPINQKLLYKSMVKLLKKKSFATGSAFDRCIVDQAESPEIENTELPVRDIASIDVQKAMAELGIDQKVFERVLVGFYENHKNIIDRTKQLFNDRDFDQLTSLAHSIKGSSANIRAQAVKDVAEKIEIACRQGDETGQIGALLNDLEQTLGTLLQELSHIKTSRSGHVAPESEMDIEKLTLILHKLKDALEMYDPEEIGVLTESLKAGIDTPLIKHFEDKIAIYDYLEAAAILKDLAKSCRIELGD